MDSITILLFMIFLYLTDTIKLRQQIKLLETTMINSYGISTSQIWILNQIFKRTTLENIASKLHKDILKSSLVFFLQAASLNSLSFLEGQQKKQEHVFMLEVLMMKEMLQIL